MKAHGETCGAAKMNRNSYNQSGNGRANVCRPSAIGCTRFNSKASRLIRRLPLQSAGHGVGDGVAEMLLSYSWPVNVRELRNVMDTPSRLLATTRSPSKTCLTRFATSEVQLDSHSPGICFRRNELITNNASIADWSRLRPGMNVVENTLAIGIRVPVQP